MERKFHAEGDAPNLSTYMMNVIANVPDDDTSVINPTGAPVSTDYSMPDVYVEDTTRIQLSEIISRMTTLKTVDVSWPIGHAAIEDTRIFVDTLQLPQTYTGYADGTLPLQFTMFNGINAPDRVVKITIAPFSFPHINTPDNAVFDIFYFRRVFMIIQFVPTSAQIQNTGLNNSFTFEMRVDDITAQAVYLTPINPTYTLNRPMTGIASLSVSFRTQSPSLGGFIAIPIPPVRVPVAFVEHDAVSTKLRLVNDPITILAPVGAVYTVPIILALDPDIILPPPPHLFEDLYPNNVGYNTSNFLAVDGIRVNTFTIPTPPAAAAALIDSGNLWMIIPKNSISFVLRFSCTQSTTTNHLLPMHE
jgi:hypothetical protein